MTTPKLDLDQLQKLCDEATPGPWYVSPNGSKRHIRAANFGTICDMLRDTRVESLIPINDANAELIVAVVNALPRLISELREARNKIGRLEGAIEYRNLVESKAHRLFTEALSNGIRLAHGPNQCNPLGFVEILRAAIERLIQGEPLNNPFIHPEDAAIAKQEGGER